MQLISSSRHGIVSPAELEPFQCFVLFYTSSWVVPQTKNRRLTKIFGPTLVPRIEAHIRDEFNGEQIPGTSFMIETGSSPCKYIVCTSIARNANCLSTDYAYNAFRSALLTIYNYNRINHADPITSILLPAMESITLPPYNLVHQMATCYEYWDWHMYAKGAVLPLTHEDEDNINKQIKCTSPSLVRIAQDLDQYIRVELLASRGLVYDSELQIILDWLTSNKKPKKEKEKNKSNFTVKTDLPKHVIAQVLVDLLKRPDIPPFTLTPSQICSGITGAALDSILRLAKERKVKIYDEIKPEDLKFGEMVAQGTSGKVSVADWGPREVAVKVFVELQPELFMQELTMISLVRHPKLVEAIGGYFDQNTAYIVTELLDMNLLQVLQHRSINLQFNAKLKIAIDVAEAMEFLHSRNVVHRDLKSVNVLVNRYTMVAKVCDFGLSRVIDCTSTLTGNIGTVGWIAPEIFQNKQYTEKCDVYSFGIILYELVAQILPFKDVPSFKIPSMVVKGIRPTIPAEVLAVTPKDYLDLMKMCWHGTSSKRPSFSAILAKLQALVVKEVPVPGDSFKDDDEELEYNSSSDDDDDSTESSNGTMTGNVLEQEEVALEELKPFLKRIRHPLVNEELLLKCIRARNCKPVAAKHLLLRYIEWYQLLTTGKPVKISDVRKTLESQVLFYVEGAMDIEGRNIIFWDLSNYDVDTTPEPVLMRTFIYCLERATERAEAQTKGIVVLANLSNWSMSRFSTRIVNSFFGTVRKYFPVIVHRILFLNAPGWFFKVLTMYQSFIASTMDLIELVTQQQLQEYIHVDNLVPAAQGSYHFDMELWIRTRYAAEGLDYQ